MDDKFIITTRKDLKITASVGIVSPITDLCVYYFIKNKRGWDIPGGRIKKNEEPNKTFEREFKEETGSTLKSIIFIATLESKLIPGTGINVYYGICCKEKFEPSKEVSHVKLLSRKEAVKHYFGDKNILASLFDLCEKSKNS